MAKSKGAKPKASPPPPQKVQTWTWQSFQQSVAQGAISPLSGMGAPASAFTPLSATNPSAAGKFFSGGPAVPVKVTGGSGVAPGGVGPPALFVLSSPPRESGFASGTSTAPASSGGAATSGGQETFADSTSGPVGEGSRFGGQGVEGAPPAGGGPFAEQPGGGFAPWVFLLAAGAALFFLARGR